MNQLVSGIHKGDINGVCFIMLMLTISLPIIYNTHNKNKHTHTYIYVEVDYPPPFIFVITLYGGLDCVKPLLMLRHLLRHIYLYGEYF